MNAEDALAAIKDVEKTSEKGRKEDDCGIAPIVSLATKVKGKTKRPLKR